MAYDPTPIDKGFDSTAGMGAEGSMGRQGDYQPRVMDPASGRQMQKGSPVDNAGPSKPPPPGVRNPVVSASSPFARMKKGSPVPTAAPGGLGGKIGQGIRDVGETVKESFFNPGKGAARNRGAKGR